MCKINSRSSGRDVYRAALRGQRARDCCGEIQGLYEDLAGHFNAVFNAGRNPDGAVGRGYPLTLFGVYPHHSFAGIDQLMPIVVRVRSDLLRVRMTDRITAHEDPVLDRLVGPGITLTLFRHCVAF